MAEKNTTLWFYLVRRDRKAVRLLAKASGKDVMANRIDNIDQFNLPDDWTTKIKQITYDNRMLWELWIESFDSYNDLKAALNARNYSNIPMSPQPEISASRIKMPTANLKNIPVRKTMLRKQV